MNRHLFDGDIINSSSSSSCAGHRRLIGVPVFINGLQKNVFSLTGVSFASTELAARFRGVVPIFLMDPDLRLTSSIIDCGVSLASTDLALIGVEPIFSGCALTSEQFPIDLKSDILDRTSPLSAPDSSKRLNPFSFSCDNFSAFPFDFLFGLMILS